jgi:hypothetical protein
VPTIPVHVLLFSLPSLRSGPDGVRAERASASGLRDQVESMKQSLTPDSSALVVVLDDRCVKDVERDLNQANDRAVIANQIASR